MIYPAILDMLKSGLFLDEIVHGLFAFPIAIFVWNRTKSVKKLLLYFVIVYLIDLDHWIDYWEFYGFEINFLKYVRLEYFEHKNTAYIPFHAWEWVVILVWLGSRTKEKLASYYSIVGLGLFAHMSWDVIGLNSVVFYSVLYRALKGFILP